LFFSHIPEDIVIDRVLMVKQDVHTKPHYSIVNRSSSAFIYVLSGTAVYHVGEHSCSVGQDDVFYLAQHDSYTIDVEQPGQFSYIFVNFILSDFCQDAFRSDLCMGNSSGQLLELFGKLENTYYAKRSLYLLECRLILGSILITMFSTASKKYLPSARHRPIIDAAAIMERDYGDPSLSIGMIAKKAGLSEGYLRRQFRDYYRTAPSHYLQNLRISHAKDLLSSTDLAITGIADRCGFTSVYYFSTVFRKHTGLSPTAWREKHIGSGL